jgi:acetyltransferase
MALAIRKETGETVGVARRVREDDPLVAEFAVIVQPDLQARGLATHLMERLLDWASPRGVREVMGEVLAEKVAMIDLAGDLGFHLRHLPEDRQIIEARLALLRRRPGRSRMILSLANGDGSSTHRKRKR